MLTPSEQSRRAVLLASLENALGPQIAEVGELVELERKDATSRPLHADRFDCLKCGPAVAADDDGCCAQCGRGVVFIKDSKPICGGDSGCQVCGADGDVDGVRQLGNYRACLGCEPNEDEEQWRRELNRMINESLFLSDKDSYAELEHYKTMDDRGVMRWGTNLFWKVEEISSEMRELWTLEQLRRNVRAKSTTIILPEEVAVLMPGDYVVPHGAYKFSPNDRYPDDRWLFMGERDDSCLTEESTNRILAALNERGAQILASMVES